MSASTVKEIKSYIDGKIKKGHSYIGVPVKSWSNSDILYLQKIADKHGFPVEWLANLINFESGGTFNPKIQNSIGATGLIQFLRSTAIGLGTTTDALKQMSVKRQLVYVDKYITNALKNKGVLKSNGEVKESFTQQDLFMTIFYPVAVGKPNYIFPANVQRANSGIRTPKGYTAKALKSAPFKSIPSSILAYKKTFKKGSNKVKLIWILGIAAVAIGGSIALFTYLEKNK
tara:strand:- start:11850 stop:12539 length:690 start_codon:yes stop_codon:yes gene_type:complete